MNNLRLLPGILIIVLILSACGTSNRPDNNDLSIRPLRDTIGFAQYPWQMDSIMARIDRKGWNSVEGEPWKMAICPHDDYTYVGSMYPEVLHNIKSDVVIIIGVAHKAAALGLEDSLLFDSHSHWKGPWKDVKVSDARNDIYNRLANNYAIVSDTMHRVEHSLESLIPFLQYFNRDVEIIPILVPVMDTDRMEECGKALAGAIKGLAEENNWDWGIDYSIVVTTDAVHYGTEEWGGKDYARFGCDDEGNQKARDYENEIISATLLGEISTENIRLFNEYTLNPDNYREYIWTWCGRYCVPLTMHTVFNMDTGHEIKGELIGYSTSITHEHIPVDDILMGRTAVATDCHWVGYAALGYR